MPRLANDSDDLSKPHYHSQALSRGLEILKFVAAADGPTTLTGIHEMSGLPKSTLVRLLSVLEDDHYVVRVDERPAYQLGHGLVAITLGYLKTASVSEIVRPHLTALAARTGWTANFGILDGSEIVHLCVEFPERPIHYKSTEGSLHSAHSTGLGKAILAHLDADALDRSLPPGPFEQLTPHTITTRERMVRELEATRLRGYAIDAEEADMGLRCLAVAVSTESGHLGAISVSGPSGEAGPGREAEFVEALQATRDELLAIPELRAALGLYRRTDHN